MASSASLVSTRLDGPLNGTTREGGLVPNGEFLEGGEGTDKTIADDQLDSITAVSTHSLNRLPAYSGSRSGFNTTATAPISTNPIASSSTYFLRLRMFSLMMFHPPPQTSPKPPAFTAFLSAPFASLRLTQIPDSPFNHLARFTHHVSAIHFLPQLRRFVLFASFCKTHLFANHLFAIASSLCPSRLCG